MFNPFTSNRELALNINELQYIEKVSEKDQVLVKNIERPAVKAVLVPEEQPDRYWQ